MPTTLKGYPQDRGESDLTLVIERLNNMAKEHDRYIKKLVAEKAQLRSEVDNARIISGNHQKQIGDLIVENKKLKEQLNESK